MAQYRQPIAYGLTQALLPEPPAPVVALRIPTTADIGYALGTVWVAKNVPSGYILVSVVANVALWQLVAPAGSGSFATITSTGQFTLDTTTAAANTLGNVNGATSVSILVGTGGFSVDGVTNSNYSVGASTTTGTIVIGGSAQSGAITLGSSTAAQTINIGLGSTASKTVVVASGTAGNTVSINDGINTVANVTTINNGAAAAASTVSILSGAATAGAQTLNLANGNFAKTVNMATGTLGNTVNIATGINSVAQVVNVSSGASAGDSTVNILTGAATAGVSTLNLANGNYAKTVNMATGTLGNTVNIATGINSVAQVVSISNGASAGDSTVNILSGAATAGVSTLNLANGNYAKTVNMATGTLGSTVNILSGINSVAQVFNLATGASAANSTVNIMSGTSTAGTSTLNLATGAYAHSINMGTGAAVVNTIAVGGTGANVITVGNTQTAGSISLGAAMTTGTINLGSALSGLVSMPFVSVTAAGTTVVNNVRVGQAIYTGNVTGNGVALVLTLTNSFISATSSIFLTVSNLGANDAQMTLYRVLPGAGTCSITLFNNGSAALNGDVQVSFWVN